METPQTDFRKQEALIRSERLLNLRAIGILDQVILCYGGWGAGQCHAFKMFKSIPELYVADANSTAPTA